MLRAIPIEAGLAEPGPRRREPERYFPLPEGADPSSAKVTREGELVRVVFSRKG